MQSEEAEDALLSGSSRAARAAIETSERILDAAVRQAEEFGVRRFTIGDVAQRVGVSRVTVYKYFPGKDRLIEAVLLHEMRRFLRDVDAAVRPTTRSRSGWSRVSCSRSAGCASTGCSTACCGPSPS